MTDLRHLLAAIALAAPALLGLSGCSKGVDRALVTDKGVEAYKVSVAEAAADMDLHQAEAFDWAVSDLTLEKLHATYPNQSARQVIRGEVQNVLDRFPALIAQLEEQTTQWNAAAEPIRQVVADGVSFALEKDFHGLQPRIRATVRNGSPLSFSTLRWRAELYIDGRSEPAATTELFDPYKDDGGLAPGATARREFTVGFVTGDPNWTTLEIQNAQRREVKLVVMPEGAKDFGERLYVGDSPAQRLGSLKATLAAAEKYKDI